MTAYNIVNPSALVAGQPEDISVVLANLQAIAGVLNGNLDNANLAAAAGIAATKLAGYPSDATKVLKGDGTWGPAGSAGVTPIQWLNPFNANSYWTVYALTAWYPGHWEFTKDVDGYIYGQVLVPAGVTAATLRVIIAANATSGVTRLSARYQTVADGESLNFGAWGTTTPSQDIVVPGTAYRRKDVTFGLTGLTGGSYLAMSLGHEGAHANDTLAVNTLLFGGWLEPA